MEGFTPKEASRHNRIVRAWLKKGQMKYMQETASTPTGSGSLHESWNTSTKRENGVVSVGIFKFARHGVFREMGVFGGLTREQAKRFGKLRPIPVVNPWIDENLEDLAKEIANNNALAILNATRLKIKNA